MVTRQSPGLEKSEKHTPEIAPGTRAPLLRRVPWVFDQRARHAVPMLGGLQKLVEPL